MAPLPTTQYSADTDTVTPSKINEMKTKIFSHFLPKIFFIERGLVRDSGALILKSAIQLQNMNFLNCIITLAHGKPFLKFVKMNLISYPSRLWLKKLESK